MQKLVISLMLLLSGLVQAQTLGEFLQTESGMKIARESLKLHKKVVPREVSTTILRETDRYVYQQMDLRFEAIGRARLWLRFPKVVQQPVPLVFLLGGVQSSSDLLKIFPERGDQIVAIFDFGGQQYDKLYQTIIETAKQLPYLQGRIAASLAYLSTNTTVDQNRINVIMVSFGSFIGPLALRLAEPLLPAPINSTVFAFGGGSIAKLILPKLKPALSEADFAAVSRDLKNVLDLVEPKHHLPYLKGRFLVIHGDSDKVISAESGRLIDKYLKEPTVITLPFGHINSDHADIIERTLFEVEKWMKTNGAI